MKLYYNSINRQKLVQHKIYNKLIENFAYVKPAKIYYLLRGNLKFLIIENFHVIKKVMPFQLRKTDISNTRSLFS